MTSSTPGSAPTDAPSPQGSEPTVLDHVITAMGGEHRPQQQHLHKTVHDTLRESGVLLAQAGTGTGKSVAYLSAAVGAGRTIIATSTNQLSEQLLRKDLPTVQKAAHAAGHTLTYSQLKGRANYVCLARLHGAANLEPDAGDDSATQLTLDPTSEDTTSGSPSTAGRAAKTLHAWANKTHTGDRSEAPIVPDRVWKTLSVTSAQCLGSACSYYQPCFTEKARRKARATDVVVTNHALLAQDIKATLEGSESSIFGDYDAVIIDEAHDFTDTLTEALSHTINPTAAQKHVKKAATLAADDAAAEAAEAAHEALDALNTTLRDTPEQAFPETPTHLRQQLSACAHYLLPLIRYVQAASEQASPAQKMTAKSTSDALADECEAILTAAAPNPDTVIWVEHDNTNPTARLHVAPLRITDAINHLTTRASVVATSATLTVNGSFDPLTRTWGVPHAATLDVGTPFAYPQQGILYIPDSSMPEPVGATRRDHSAAVTTTLTDLISAAGGRTLALFTTTAAARANGEHLAGVFPTLNILTQGDAPADTLVQEFRDDETSVLCATMGLWQGVDVPGPSCSLVVIDKIPFPPPDDALASARKTDLDEQGDDGFHLVFVATAATSLAQAAGRLIRTSSDKGVVAILDPRLRTKRYGTTLTGSLPPFHPSNDPDAVTAALTRLTGQPPLTPSTRPRKPGKKTTPRKKNSPTRSNRSGSAPAPSRGGSRAGSGKKTSPTRKRIPPKKRP